MGGLLSSLMFSPHPVKKRRRNPDVDDELRAPLIKRIRSTYEHVYQELFSKGEGSDVIICALGHEWALHRIYLKQSPFFAALFNGGWKESSDRRITLNLLDENITQESLNIVFGSFYSDYVPLTDRTVVGILAAATWFQMDEIRRLCSDFLCRHVKLESLIHLHAAAAKYNLPELNQACVNWLVRSLTILPDCPPVFELMKRVPIPLMQSVVSCPKLVVVQFEEDVFTCLLKWLYLRLNPEKLYCCSSQLLAEAYKYFAKDAAGFLESAQGAAYAPVFRAIRWEHVISHFRSTCQIIRDGIVPHSWLQKACQRQWLQQLRCHDLYLAANGSTTNSQNSLLIRTPQLSSLLTAARGESATSRERGIAGPQSNVSAEVFWRRCERLGRRINDGEVPCTWRWSGYHFGVDLLFKYRRRAFHVVRPTDSLHSEGVVCTSRKYSVKIVLTVICIADEDYSPSSFTTVAVDNGDSTPNSSSTAAERPEPEESEQVGEDDAVTAAGTATVGGGTVIFPADGSARSRRPQICTSELKTLRMVENAPYELLRLPDDFLFPVVVSANILRYDP
ncbi:unnamed protein product [Taenia asiatica]|uniref:BTB domain-containing protein n=1 Tax=Taenia asiatica TaxID=60517 RepID=A0A158R9Y3_TAEAS|nr:unnamed protein product [Taenia asiatica]